jgi:hypothetical protein
MMSEKVEHFFDCTGKSKVSLKGTWLSAEIDLPTWWILVHIVLGQIQKSFGL